MERFLSHSEAETQQFASRLAQQISKPCLICFYGGLGVGKTAFVKGMLDGFGFRGHVHSPTFSIMNEYRIPDAGFSVFHFDMYRITSPMLESVGFYDALDSSGAVLVEWSENIADALDMPHLNIRLSYGEQPDDRMIEIDRKEAV